MNSRFLLITVVLLSILLLPITGSCKPIAHPVRFSILGDRTGGHEKGIYEGIISEVNALHPDFTVTVGDMIEGYCKPEQAEKQWQEYKQIIAKLQSPIYYTPGNHDLDFPGLEQIYRNNIGKPYYSFERDNIHFTIIDNSRWECYDSLPREQKDWIEQDLSAKTTAAYKIVLMHIPFWSLALDRHQPDNLHAILKRNGVDAVFCGHHHHYYMERIEGILYVACGSSSGIILDPIKQNTYMHHLVTVDSNGIEIHPICNGITKPMDMYSYEDQLQGWRLGHESIPEFHTTKCMIPVLSNPTDHLEITNCELVFKNVSKFSQSDTFHLTTVDGWEITPASIPFATKPDETFKITWSARPINSSASYPKISLSTNFIFNPNKPVMKYEIPIQVNRKLLCETASVLPTLDGVIQPDEWHQPVTVLFDLNGENSHTEPTKFYFTHSQHDLYIAVECTESNPKSIIANVNQRDDNNISSDDCVGFFFGVGELPASIYQIYFTTNGSVFDGEYSYRNGHLGKVDLKWNSEYEVKTHIGTKSWSIEIRIPLAQLGPNAEIEKNWKLNFRRRQQRTHSVADWEPLDRDLTAKYGSMEFR